MTMDAKTKLISKIAQMTTKQILDCLAMIGGGMVAVEQRMVRAYLFEEYEKREGGEALDELFEAMGM
jgi:hypothetical protein